MNQSLKIALVSTDYPPLKTSAAVQMRDLAVEFAALGHKPVMIIPTSEIDVSWTSQNVDGVEVLRLRAPETRVEGYLRRAIAELLLPFIMLRNLRKTPLKAIKWDLVVWYSPPIFFAPLIWAISRSRRTKKYLILRDIFPEWAVDLGIMKRGLAYLFLKAIAACQYFVADTIGVQTESNLAYLSRWRHSTGRKVEVLQNWLAPHPVSQCSISIASTPLARRKIFAYIGNMGIAQGVGILLDLAESLKNRTDIGFIFVGRGSDFAHLVAECRSRGLSNVMLFDEIDSSEIAGLLAQCEVGLVALHPAHKTHNIPGKFVSYMQYGIPVLARVNAGTDLVSLIESKDVGRVYVGDSVDELKRIAEELADDDELRKAMSERCKRLGRSMFSPRTAAEQIMNLVE